MAKHYFSKLLNSDDAPHLIDPGEVVNLENFRAGTSDEGLIAGLRNIKGTVQRSGHLLPSDDSACRTIGAATDESERYVVWFLHCPDTSIVPGEDQTNYDDTDYNQINIFDTKTATGFAILSSFDVKLNFKDTNWIESCIINNTLYWVDGLNNSRQLHLGAAIKRVDGGDSTIPSDFSYSTPFNEYDITLIKQPFGFPPSLEKKLDGSYVLNRIEKNSFQFAVRFTYWTGERSVLSTWSRASKFNGDDDDFNYITVTLPFGTIPQGVRIVELIMIKDSKIAGNVIKTWDKKISDESDEIDAHNAGTTALAFDFYNNAVGEAIDTATLIQPFHSVPLTSATITPARNRIHLANNKEGYETPGTTSLTIDAPVEEGGGGADGSYQLYKIKGKYVNHVSGDPATWLWRTVTCYAVFLTTGVTPGYYQITPTRVELNNTGSDPGYPVLGVEPTTADFADLFSLGSTVTTVTHFLETTAGYIPFGSAVITTDVGFTCVITGLSGEGSSLVTQFKSGGEYQACIWFLDPADRKCGVVTKSTLRFQIPKRDYAFGDRVPVANWALSNADSTDEIPIWADRFVVGRTMNLKTRFFLETIANEVKYFKKDTDGTYTALSGTTFDDTVAAIGVDTAALIQAGLGYIFEDGDICYLYDDAGGKYELPVVFTTGTFILMKSKDIGDLTGRSFGFEIYTPYTPTGIEDYFEVGQVYAINNPHTIDRTYSVLTGVLPGDVFVNTRTWSLINYDAEVMCPNDKYWTRWDNDAGRNNIVTKEGEAIRKTGARFSNTFIPGTQTNGLSAFEVLNQYDFPLELVAVRKLILADKTQSEGTVLVAIGEKETADAYLGEGELAQGSNSTMIRTINVVGQINVLKGSMGTLNPESVARDKGRLFWLDVNNDQIASRATNGLFAVSDYKLRRATKYLCGALRAEDSIPHVPGGIDPFHGEFMLSVPQTEGDPPKGNTDSYTLPEVHQWPFDYYDGQAKVWIYKINADKGGGSLRFQPEYFISIAEQAFSFKTGILWEHNKGDYDSLYGQTVKPMVAIVDNGEPDSLVKVFDLISIEGNKTPSFTSIVAEGDDQDGNHYQQISDLVGMHWNRKEGQILYASVLRDRLSPNTTGDADYKLNFGDRIRGQWALIAMEFEGGSQTEIRFINVSYKQSTGHKNI